MTDRLKTWRIPAFEPFLAFLPMMVGAEPTSRPVWDRWSATYSATSSHAVVVLMVSGFRLLLIVDHVLHYCRLAPSDLIRILLSLISFPITAANMFRLVTTFATLAPLAAARGPAATLFARNSFATMARGGASTEFETLAPPAPGSPFHYAFPVHNLDAAKEFYGSVLGCAEGRSSEKVGSSDWLL